MFLSSARTRYNRARLFSLAYIYVPLTERLAKFTRRIRAEPTRDAAVGRAHFECRERGRSSRRIAGKSRKCVGLIGHPVAPCALSLCVSLRAKHRPSPNGR
jgi:hypothetical protein